MSGALEVFLSISLDGFNDVTEALTFYAVWHELEATKPIYPPDTRNIYSARAQRARVQLAELEHKFVKAPMRRAS